MSTTAHATVVADEGFNYAAGDLDGQNGGSGDWKDAWSADGELDVVLGSYSYTDGIGNQLITTEGHVALDSDPGGVKKAERAFNDKLGKASETFWFSAILNGSPSSSVTNISLGGNLFFGQGDKDSGTSNWVIADQTGVIGDSGISANTLSFLVVRIDFQAGREDVWLWVDPLLSSAPQTSDADAASLDERSNRAIAMFEQAGVGLSALIVTMATRWAGLAASALSAMPMWR